MHQPVARTILTDLLQLSAGQLGELVTNGPIRAQLMDQSHYGFHTLRTVVRFHPTNMTLGHYVIDATKPGRKGALPQTIKGTGETSNRQCTTNGLTAMKQGQRVENVPRIQRWR